MGGSFGDAAEFGHGGEAAAAFEVEEHVCVGMEDAEAAEAGDFVVVNLWGVEDGIGSCTGMIWGRVSDDALPLRLARLYVHQLSRFGLTLPGRPSPSPGVRPV